MNKTIKNYKEAENHIEKEKYPMIETFSIFQAQFETSKTALQEMKEFLEKLKFKREKEEIAYKCSECKKTDKIIEEELKKIQEALGEK